jgi:hypothetical protein
MKLILNKFKSLLGASHPTVSSYKTLIGSLSEEEVNKLQRDLFDLACSHWHDLPCEYKRFICRLLVHNQKAFLRVYMGNSYRV